MTDFQRKLKKIEERSMRDDNYRGDAPNTTQSTNGGPSVEQLSASALTTLGKRTRDDQEAKQASSSAQVTSKRPAYLAIPSTSRPNMQRHPRQAPKMPSRRDEGSQPEQNAPDDAMEGVQYSFTPSAAHESEDWGHVRSYGRSIRGEKTEPGDTPLGSDDGKDEADTHLPAPHNDKDELDRLFGALAVGELGPGSADGKSQYPTELEF
jgi:hypothetical protein